MVLDNKDSQSVIYTSSDFTISNAEELKSGKDVYITGYISTTNRDTNNDIVTEKAQLSLIDQINDKSRAGQNVTMDLDHESFERQKDNPLKTTGKILNKIPVALIEDAQLVEEDGVAKTKVKALVNSAHPLYDSIVKSMKKGFLHSFSIVYKVTDGFNTMMDNNPVRVINDVLLRNIGITGVPVNEDAGFALSLKSYLKKMEETKLNELNTSVDELKSKVESFEKVEEELKSQITEKNSVIEELKSQLAESSKSVDEKIASLELEELKSKVESTEELKSKVESLEKTLEELKSRGVHKAHAPSNEKKTEDVNVFALM